jgi:DNA-binding response OmpR family regulator
MGSEGVRTVLVVDDDREIQRYLTERLESEGWRVIVEKDGDWALRTFERRPVDAVILDILIPVISGFQVAERIRALPMGKEVGILMITGIYRGAKHRSEAMQKYRLLDYLDKPVEGETVVAILQKHFATIESTGVDPRPAPDPEPPPKPAALVDEQQKQEKREVERAAAKLEPKTPAAAGQTRVIRGNLKRTSFPELLAQLYRRRVTGGLFLLRDKVKKIVYFDEGHPTYIKSNVLDECLGRVLVREKMITDKECEESVRRMKEQKRQQGSVLIEMGVISPHNLRFGLETQLQIKLFDIFHWREGEYVFRDDVPLPGDVISLDTSNAQIVLEGVRRAWDAERLRGALNPIVAQYLDHAAEPELRYQDLELAPVEQGFIESIDGARTTKEVMKRAPAQVGERGAMGLIYALHCIGVLQTREAPASIRRVSTHSGFVQLPESRGDHDATPDMRLAAFLAARRHADPFTVLGVPRDSTIDDIERVFSQLAREFHPDRFRGQPETTARLAREAFEMVAAARQELDDPERRRQIAVNLEGIGSIRAPNGTDTFSDSDTVDEMRPQVAFEEAPTTDPDHPRVDPAARALTADRLFKQGQERLRARNYAEAEALFRQAVELRDDVGRYHAFLGWALFCLRGQGQRAADEALPILEHAAELSPTLEEPHLFLGMIWNSVERPDLAEREFEKAMQSNPDSAEALRELRLLHMRREQRR